MKRPHCLSLEIAFDIFVVVLGVVVALISWIYGFGTFKRPGPGLYPFFIGLSAAAFGTVLLIAEWGAPDRPPSFHRGEVRTFLSALAVFCLWILLMPLLGYVLVTLLATLGFTKIMKLEGWWKPVSLSAGTTLFVYLMFDYWLYIDLPRGFLR